MSKLQTIVTISAVAFGLISLTASLSNSHQKDTQPSDNHIVMIIMHFRRPNLYPNVTEKLCGSHSWYVLEDNEDGSGEPKRYVGCDIRVYQEIPPPPSLLPKPSVCNPDSSDRC